MELMKSHVSDFTGYLVAFQQTAAQLDCVLWCFVSMSLDLWKTPTAEKARPWQHYRRQLWRWKIDHKSRYGKHSFGRLGWQKIYPSIMYHFNEWLGGFSVLYICLCKWKLQQSTLVDWDGGKVKWQLRFSAGRGQTFWFNKTMECIQTIAVIGGSLFCNTCNWKWWFSIAGLPGVVAIYVKPRPRWRPTFLLQLVGWWRIRPWRVKFAQNSMVF